MADFDHHERREINDAIEQTYKELSRITGKMRAYFQSEIGVIDNLYNEMIYYFAVLIELTEVLEQMKQSTDIINRANIWLDLPAPKEKEIKERCKEGLNLIREYKVALVASGLMSLPTGAR